MKKIIYFSLALLIIASLSSFRNNDDTKIATKGDTNIKYTKLKLDKHEMTGFLSSGKGKILLFEKHLLFLDGSLAKVFSCNLNGKFEKVATQKGSGPHDIQACRNATYSNGKLMFYGNWITTVMSKDFEKESISRFNTKQKKSMEELMNNPKPSDMELYEPDVPLTNIEDYDKEHYIIAVTTEHPKFNAYGNGSDLYYKEAYLFALVNKKTGNVSKMMGHRPSSFLEKKYIPNYNIVYFNIDNDIIYASFAPDANIYVLDKEGNYKYKFGKAGKDMRTNYRTYKDFRIAEKNYREDIEKYDYYTGIKYIKETGLLFRSYKKKLNDFDGLQVYKNNSLIADINVPKGFKVFGYKKGKYFAQGKIDDEHIEFYKFKLAK
ncbi:hypothetical protein E0494_00415 [Marinilabiliaceae bacterium JC040]|nr:hypothetical protein [Marinilabiliaceae bacterium JC040]